MLKYNYSLNMSSNVHEIILDDFYVSPDLSFVSGTTNDMSACVPGRSIYIHSSFFPNDISEKVTSNEIVKRNGYVLVPRVLKVNKLYVDSGSEPDYVYYTELNGNTYYSKSYDDGYTQTFIINDKYYSCRTNSPFIEVQDKIYIENNKLRVNNATYNTLIVDGKLFLTDSTGVPYIYPNTWDISNISNTTTTISKLTVGENFKHQIKCNRVTYYGHIPYIVYGGEKKYLEYYTDDYGEKIGGVIINGSKYKCDALYYVGNSHNLYNIKDYYMDDNGNATMTVEGGKYIIYFEPGDVYGSNIIGIETSHEHMPILINDKIVIHSIDNTSKIIVKNNGDAENTYSYVYISGRRYDVIPNLCDSVEIGGVECELTYDGDCTNIIPGMIASCIVSGGECMYFETIDRSGVIKLKKIEYKDGIATDSYTMMRTSGGTVEYSTIEYDIIHHDGVRLDDYNARVYHYSGGTYEAGAEILETLEEYDYIILDSPVEYMLRVINTVGSNLILCVPDIDIESYNDFSIMDLTAEILYSISDNNFVVEKRQNSFGLKDLYYNSWITEAYNSETPISVYNLADIYNNISFIVKSSYFMIPIGLYKDTNIHLEYEDIITTKYYDEEEEKAINNIVDMEKDVYTPAFVNGDTFTEVDEMTFNFHFRTRDIQTWKIINDEGYYSSSGNSQPLSADYQYCNWFVTDYYPYNHLTNIGRGKMMTEMSDLLGLMYFTTDDIKFKKDKLEKSFLRLTLFDSINPETQNMLGTSTIYMDCDKLQDLLSLNNDTLHYEEVAKSQNIVRMDGGNLYYQMDRTINSPNVLTEAFIIPVSRYPSVQTMVISDIAPTLNSKMRVYDRFSSNGSSEGFYMYILKAFANKKEKQTIYMKAEFFHAGVGIKIPMVIATNKEKNAITEVMWQDNAILDEFKLGYDLNSVFERMYIPITIEYSKDLKKFIYYIGSENNYQEAIQVKKEDGQNKLVFNLFELKIKAQ